MPKTTFYIIVILFITDLKNGQKIQVFKRIFFSKVKLEKVFKALAKMHDMQPNIYVIHS